MLKKPHSANLYHIEKHPVSSDTAVSIVIPVYNAAATIELLVEKLIDHNPGFDLQIVLVNDGSIDGSAKACARSAERHGEVVLFVDLARNVGEHNAVMAGLSHACGDYCVIMDDDFQNPPEEAYSLVRVAIRDDRDIVFSAYSVKKHHWFRNLGSKVVNRAAGWLLDLPSGLYLSSFKCLSRFTVEHVLTYRGPFPYIDGLALRATRNIGVVKTFHDASAKGKSTYTTGKLASLCFSLLVNFSVRPLRSISIFGLMMSVFGIIGAVGVVAEKLSNPDLPIGWPSLAFFSLFLSGVQLLMLGVMGEYIGQLVMTVNGTPQYVVRSVIGRANKKRRAEDAGAVSART